MTRKPRIAIIGGGIAGLAAAVALHRRGVEVAVYEQAGELSEIGAGVQMTPNAMRALRSLGVEEAAMRVAFEPESQVLRSWKSGRTIYRAPVRRVFRENFGAPLCSFHRADLLSVLAAPLPAGVIHLNARCIAVEPGERVAAVRFADGSEVEADIAVGADGIHSTVRHQLFGADSPRFTGCMCWRGLVPVERIPRGLVEPSSLNWMGPRGHVVHYYVRRGEMVNFVAIHDTEQWTEESWILEADRAELMATYAGWHDNLLRLFECSDRYFKWGLFDREPLPRYLGIASRRQTASNRDPGSVRRAHPEELEDRHQLDNIGAPHQEARRRLSYRAQSAIGRWRSRSASGVRIVGALDPALAAATGCCGRRRRNGHPRPVRIRHQTIMVGERLLVPGNDLTVAGSGAGGHRAIARGSLARAHNSGPELAATVRELQYAILEPRASPKPSITALTIGSHPLARWATRRR